MSEHARSFITSALTKDASKRPSVLQLLNHPWINTYRARRSMRSININAALSTPSGVKPLDAAVASSIAPAHSVTMPPTPGSNLAGNAAAAGNFFSGGFGCWNAWLGWCGHRLVLDSESDSAADRSHSPEHGLVCCGTASLGGRGLAVAAWTTYHQQQQQQQAYAGPAVHHGQASCAKGD